MSFPTKVHIDQENVSKQTSEAAAPVKLKPNREKEATPPKPPRSAFMCFTDVIKKEVMARHGIEKENDDLLKLVANEWQVLSDQERARWDEEERNDKLRFVREKAEFKGTWAVPKRRAKKHPLAPKRPPSAFLKFSQNMRSVVKQTHPHLKNTDVSRLLGEMWRNAGTKERAPYVEQEERERATYKERIKKFRDEQARADAASRTSHKSVQEMAEYPQQAYSHQAYSEPAKASFDAFNLDTVEEAANKADQRVMVRHPFGPPPFSPYHPSWDNGSRHVYHTYHNTGYRTQISDHTPLLHRPLPFSEDDDDVTYNNSYGNYFSEGNTSFNFYNGYS